MFDPLVHPFPVICCLVILLCVSVTIELRTRRIPNWLTLIGLTAGVVLALIDQQWSLHILGFLLAFIVGIGLYVAGCASAGFIKLLVAIGTILGPIVPLVTAALMSLLWLIGFVISKFKVPAETNSEEENNSKGLLRGSVFLSMTTLISLALLFKIWD